jgi:hypothetical protein
MSWKALGRLTTMAFNRRTVALPAGSVLPYDQGEWEDALVVVKAGVIELEGLSGRRWRFPCGAMIWLTDLPIRALHNPGEETALLCAISRRPINSAPCQRPT